MTEGCTLAQGHQGLCSTAQDTGPKEGLCALTENCALTAGHEGGCVTEGPPVKGAGAEIILRWNFEGQDDFSKGRLALPGVNVGNQLNFEKVASMLPTQIQAVIEEEGGPVTVGITGWVCSEYKKDGNGNWPVTGRYTFKAVLQEGYICETEPAVEVVLGGRRLLGSPIGDFDVTGGTLNADYSYNNNILTIKDKAVVTISGTTTTDRIVVESGADAHITLDGLSITGNTWDSPFDMSGATVTLTLADNSQNKINAINVAAAIQVPNGASLTINGSGSLEVTNTDRGAAIGGNGHNSRDAESGGVITIEQDAHVIATGKTGAAIGGGGVYSSAAAGVGGDITIQGNAYVIATSEDGAAIGGGSSLGNRGGAGGSIKIQGKARVEATSVQGAAIGGGGSDGNHGGNGGTIVIKESAEVTAESSSGAAIGGGKGEDGGSDGGVSGDITIEDEAQVEATSVQGAAIGGGSGGEGGNGNSIVIQKKARVEATSVQGAAIGGGSGINDSGGNGGRITIDGDTVVTALVTGVGNAMPVGGGGGSSGNDAGAPGYISRTKGIIFEGTEGKVYGNVTLHGDWTIPLGYTLEIPEGSTLTVPTGVTLTNEGQIKGEGTLTVNGSLEGAKMARTIEAPAIDSVTPNKIILKVAVPSHGKKDGQVRYARNSVNAAPAEDSQWQDSLEFTGLTPSTTYYFFARVEVGAIYQEATSAGREGVTKALSVVTTRDVAGVTPPVFGGTPVRTISGTDEYTGAVTWQPALAGDGRFAAFTEYTATITLTPKEGYTLKGVPVGFFQVAGAQRVTNEADSGVITAVFPSTGRPPRTSTDDDSGSGIVSPDGDSSVLQGTWVQNAAGVWMFRLKGGTCPENRWGMIDGLWYYFNGEGEMATGWQFIGGQWYYLYTKEDAVAKAGVKEGAMATGWHFDPHYGKWFYLDETGAMATGWREIDGKWHYFNPASDGTRGAMVTDRVIDGWYVDENGVWNGEERKE